MLSFLVLLTPPVPTLQTGVVYTNDLAHQQNTFV